MPRGVYPRPAPKVVPKIHLSSGTAPLCGNGSERLVPEERKSEVTCARCLSFAAGRDRYLIHSAEEAKAAIDHVTGGDCHPGVRTVAQVLDEVERAGFERSLFFTRCWRGGRVRDVAIRAEDLSGHGRVGRFLVFSAGHVTLMGAGAPPSPDGDGEVTLVAVFSKHP